MSNYIIYDQTEKGRAAILAGTVTQPYLRFLQLVDGTRSVAELETVARPGELEQTIRYLIQQGYISKTSETTLSDFSVSNFTDPFSQAALTEDMFTELKRRAVDELLEKFGEHARPLIVKIQNCLTPQEMRACLRAAQNDIAGGPDAEVVRQFVQRVGRNLV